MSHIFGLGYNRYEWCGSLSGYGTQHLRLSISAWEQNRSTKPSDSIGSANARCHKPFVASTFSKLLFNLSIEETEESEETPPTRSDIFIY